MASGNCATCSTAPSPPPLRTERTLPQGTLARRDIPELVARCRTYLAVHPQGKFRASAEELLRWSEKVTAPNEYRVVLRSGPQFVPSRYGYDRERCLGLVFQFHLGKRKQS